MVTIDGSEGAGGGQVLRSALALSLVTQQPMTINNIRAKRSKPGLMRQHLTAVLAAAELGNAELRGAALESSRLTFTPRRKVEAGNYEFRIGTAGSTMLVLQTVLAPLMLAAGPSRVTLEGGTHNPLAPPIDFIRLAYARVLGQMGVTVEAVLERPGFYPAGGGRCVVSIETRQQLGSLSLIERGELRRRCVRAVIARLPKHIAERECRRVTSQLDWPDELAEIETITDSNSPGNVVFVELEFEHVTEVLSSCGERGKQAEQVADHVVAQAQKYLATDVPVGEHLADQLLLPLGLGAHLGTGGGEFRTLPLSDHSLTHIAVLQKFLEIDVECRDIEDSNVCVTVSRRR